MSADLFLALRAPGRGPSTNRRAAQKYSVSRTFAARPPALMNQPRPRQGGIIRTDDAQRFAGDEFACLKNPLAFSRTYFARPFGRQNFGPPQDFVGPPF